MTAETYLLLVIAVLFVALVIVVALGRIDARAVDWLAKKNVELETKNAELETKNRHLADRAAGYRSEVTRLSARNAEMRDQLDAATGATREPTLTEAWTAFMAELDVTYPEDNR